MRPTKSARTALAIALSLWAGAITLHAQTQAIDAAKSTLTIRVFKSGLFSAFAHDHEIEAPIEKGLIDSSANPAVQLQIDARKLRVLDPESSADARAEIERTMEGSTVLDTGHFPDISYQSTSVTKTSDAHWQVRGNLALHGTTHPIAVEVTLRDGHYVGSASLKQSDFAINPIRIAGGTVKIKDEIKIEFDIIPTQ